MYASPKLHSIDNPELVAVEILQGDSEFFPLTCMPEKGAATMKRLYGNKEGFTFRAFYTCNGEELVA